MRRQQSPNVGRSRYGCMAVAQTFEAGLAVGYPWAVFVQNRGLWVNTLGVLFFVRQGLFGKIASFVSFE